MATEAGLNRVLNDSRWEFPRFDDQSSPRPTGNVAHARTSRRTRTTIAAIVGAVMVGLGDLGERAQQMLLPRLHGSKVDVVKVSHHGSRDQLPELYRQLDAIVGLIGVGSDNRYGHPTEQTLQMLQSVGTMPVRSDERGTVTLHRSERGIELWSVRDG